MKKDFKLINILNPLVNFHTYSRYSESIEKLFKKKSLRNLLYSLNHPTKFNEDHVEERLNKKILDVYSNNNDKEQKNLLEYNYEDYLKSLEEKIIKNKRKEPWSINIKEPRIPPIKRKLDFYKYNPNYNSIYKNIPSFSYNRSFKKKKNFDKEIRDQGIRDMAKNNSNLLLKTHKRNNTETIKNQYSPLLTSISCKSSKTIINNECRKNIIYDKNNHTFRFSKYSSRKPLIYKVNDKITYLNTGNNIINFDKTIDFKKMPKRNNNNLIQTYTLNNPSMCYYNPKYDCVEIETKKIKFNPEGFKKTIKFKKKKKLKKILMSYDVKKEYLTIDNSKLVKAESITKLLNLK